MTRSLLTILIYFAFLLSKQFRLYSFITIILLLVFGFITSLQAPELALGLKTPLMGFTERINIYSTMLWFAVLSVALLRAENIKIRSNDLSMVSEQKHTKSNNPKHWFALALCASVLITGVLKQLIIDRPDYADSFAPVWISLAAAVFSAAGIIQFNSHSQWHRIQRALLWCGILLMIWTANGLPFDLLRLTPLMPPGIDLPGMATRSLALAAVIVLARHALAIPANAGPIRSNKWCGFAAFLLALPYPVLRNMLGIRRNGWTHTCWSSRCWLCPFAYCHPTGFWRPSFHCFLSVHHIGCPAGFCSHQLGLLPSSSH